MLSKAAHHRQLTAQLDQTLSIEELIRSKEKKRRTQTSQA
jgi:hypothetical protein